ncbi:MAG: hypothetical protein LBE22_08715 [Azoarcus sp.]|jgi:hypothetical protein|nr:hypothetical protein [Azoarcus sp.]
MHNDEIEIIVSDSLPNPTSLFGHMAIVVDYTAYSRARTRYFVTSHGAYVHSQRKIRASVGYFLGVTQAEKIKIREELERRVEENAPYSFMSNDCTTNIVEVLKLAKIEDAYDQRGFGLVSPADFTIGLTRSRRFIRKMFYPKY